MELKRLVLSHYSIFVCNRHDTRFTVRRSRRLVNGNLVRVVMRMVIFLRFYGLALVVFSVKANTHFMIIVSPVSEIDG